MRSFLQDLPYKPLRLANRVISRLAHVRLMREAELYPWQIERPPERAFVPDTVPEVARRYLLPENPRLRALAESYATFDERATKPTQWVAGTITNTELLYFRGQNPFVAQLGMQFAESSYVLTYYALKCSSAADLLAKLEEDGLFGVYTHLVDGRLVSRDLLDSAREIDFIRTHVGLHAPETNILDIGAGYGRLIHRLGEVTGDNVQAFGTDAFAPSTFIAEFYLRFRGVKDGRVIPLNKVLGFLEQHPVKLAINIHSFSECSLEAIDWWVSQLAKHGTRYLLVIPNLRDEVSGACLTNTGESMELIFQRYGYLPHVREPRFVDPAVHRNGLDPSYLNLFKLKDAV